MKNAIYVIDKATGEEKVHCTILLRVISNGNRLPHFILFKGNKEGKNARDFQKH